MPVNMWLLRRAGLGAISALWMITGLSLAGLTYLQKTSEGVSLHIPEGPTWISSDQLIVGKRAPNLQPTRLVQFLRETINIATDDEPDPDNIRLWRICLEHVSHFLYDPTISIEPIDNAAFKLERLYDLAMATFYELIETYDFPNDPTDNAFSLRMGQVAIEWSCQAGPLCWHLLFDFCRIMKQKARQGWVGIYNGQLVNVGTGVVTWVRLTIVRGRVGGNGLAP